MTKQELHRRTRANRATTAVLMRTQRGFTNEQQPTRQSAEQFELLREIMRGEMVTVHEAFDRASQRHVAIRELNPRLHTDDSCRAMFWQEALYQSNVGHPNLVAIHARDAERYWIVTELCQRNLTAEIGKAMPAEDVEQVLVSTLSALSALHAQGLVHADIHPGAIWYDSHKNIKLARSSGPNFVGSTNGERRSAKYLAPELILPVDFGPIGASADLYSLAVLILELLTGPRFESFFRELDERGTFDDEAWARWHASSKAKLPDVEILCPSLSRGVAQVLNMMLQKQVADRFPSAHEALQQLRNADTNLPMVVSHSNKDELSDPPSLIVQAGSSAPRMVVSAREPISIPGAATHRPATATPFGVKPMVLYGFIGLQCVLTLLCLVTAAKPSAPVAEAKKDSKKSETPPHPRAVPRPVPNHMPPIYDKDTTPPAKGGDDPPPPPPPPNPIMKLTTEPSGARVILDGADAGLSPYVRQAQPGIHTVRFECPGYLPVTAEIQVVAGRPIERAFTLRRRPLPRPYQPVHCPDIGSKSELYRREIEDLMSLSTIKAVSNSEYRVNQKIRGLLRMYRQDCRLAHAYGLALAEAGRFAEAQEQLGAAQKKAPDDYLLPLRRSIWIDLVEGKEADAIGKCLVLVSQATKARDSANSDQLRERLGALVFESIRSAARVFTVLEGGPLDANGRSRRWRTRESQLLASLRSEEVEEYDNAKREQAAIGDLELRNAKEDVRREIVNRLLELDYPSERRSLMTSLGDGAPAHD